LGLLLISGVLPFIDITGFVPTDALYFGAEDLATRASISQDYWGGA